MSLLTDPRFDALARAMAHRQQERLRQEHGHRGQSPADDRAGARARRPPGASGDATPAGTPANPELTGGPPSEPPVAQAAVLLALRPTKPLELLVIERAEREGDPWSGHMALPGGRRQREDRDLMDTAIRETREETALVVPRRHVLGQLTPVVPGGPRRRFSISVTPYVAPVPADAVVTPEPSEVETALWVPLPHLASDDAVDELLIELEGESRAFPALSYQEYVIWGLTHRILEDFMDLARRAGLV